MGRTISEVVTPLGLSENVNSRLTSADISENCRSCKNGTWLANDKDGNHPTKRNILSNPNPVHYWCLSIYKHTLGFCSYQPTKALLLILSESIANKLQKTSSILSGQMVHIYSFSGRQSSTRVEVTTWGYVSNLSSIELYMRVVVLLWCIMYSFGVWKGSVKIGVWLEEYDIYRCYFRSFVPLYPHHVSW